MKLWATRECLVTQQGVTCLQTSTFAQNIWIIFLLRTAEFVAREAFRHREEIKSLINSDDVANIDFS